MLCFFVCKWLQRIEEGNIVLASQTAFRTSPKIFDVVHSVGFEDSGIYYQHHFILSNQLRPHVTQSILTKFSQKISWVKKVFVWIAGLLQFATQYRRLAYSGYRWLPFIIMKWDLRHWHRVDALQNDGGVNWIKMTIYVETISYENAWIC